MQYEDDLIDYIATINSRSLPADVELKTRMHLLDTLSAFVSGAFLPPGDIAYKFAESLGGPPEATLIGTDKKVSVCNAALANGMSGHADETDDSHIWGRWHPGCGVIPPVLALAERDGASSKQILNAIALGYDIGTRCLLSLGYTSAATQPFSTHTMGTMFGGGAAAAAMLDLTAEQVSVMLSFAAQQASGLMYWNRDPDHIEKAFVFGGKGARDGMYAALIAKAGMTSPTHALTCKRGFVDSFAQDARPQELSHELGERFEISRSTLKKWCVGSPIQSVLDAFEAILAENKITNDDIAGIHLTMPSDRLHVVDGRDIPTICVQHLAAMMIVQGTVSFVEAHKDELMDDPDIQAVRAKITATPSDELAEAKPVRQAIVEITLNNGEKLRHHTKAVHGTPDRPMNADDLAAKARDILTPYIPKTAEDLIDLCLNRDTFDVKELVALCKAK